MNLKRAVFGEIILVIVDQPVNMDITNTQTRPHVEPNNLIWKVLELAHKYGFGGGRKTILHSLRQ